MKAEIATAVFIIAIVFGGAPKLAILLASGAVLLIWLSKR